MNHSFKFIVDPNNTTQVEITSLLQYYALKNTLANFTSNNIKSLNYNENPVIFSDTITDIKPDASFTEYIQKKQSKRDTFKAEYLEDITDFSLFFNAISEIEYPSSFKGPRPWKYNGIAPNYYTVDDLYTIFMRYEYAKMYLSKYIPKNSEEVCYVRILKSDFGRNQSDFDKPFIRYDDSFVKFDVVNSNSENKEEYTRLVNCIKESVEVQISKNNGHIENTYDELCVYTEDPVIIHKVLMNNQKIIDTIAKYIFYINYRLHTNYFYKYNVFNELNTCITNVVETYESTKKETEDNLAVLNDLFN